MLSPSPRCLRDQLRNLRRQGLDSEGTGGEKKTVDEIDSRSSGVPRKFKLLGYITDTGLKSGLIGKRGRRVRASAAAALFRTISATWPPGVFSSMPVGTRSWRRFRGPRALSDYHERTPSDRDPDLCLHSNPRSQTRRRLSGESDRYTNTRSIPPLFARAT
jgi:hypothetical protein